MVLNVTFNYISLSHKNYYVNQLYTVIFIDYTAQCGRLG